MGRLGRELLRLWHEPRDPRLAQLGFTLLFLLDMTLRVVGGVDLGLAPRIAFAAAPAVWVACLLIPWRRTPEWARPIWPILDLGLVGLGRLDESGGSILLAVVPAIWLGFVFGMRGALVAAAATVGLITVPGLAYAGTTGLNLSRSVIVALMVTSVSLLLANVTARVRGGQETIEHQRRISEAMLDTVDVGLVLLDRDGLYSTRAPPASSARCSRRTGRPGSSARRCRPTAPPTARSSRTS
jgi:two-component system phosphate regulon sensor histidine kinase PhoR